MTPRFMVKYLYHEVATVNIIYQFCLETEPDKLLSHVIWLPGLQD